MELNFHPYNLPSYKNKIEFPDENKIYIKDYFNKNYYLEGKKIEDIDIDLDKLSSGRTMDESTYTLEELKKFANQLQIDKISGMSKKDLIKNIKLKLKLI